jgi:hypothetical protein
MLGVMPFEVITLCLLTCYPMLGLSYFAFWDLTPCWGYNPVYFGMSRHVGVITVTWCDIPGSVNLL